MANKIFQHSHRVTYAECTAGNHIYYSRYFDLLEAARGEFFRQIGQSFLRWQQAGTIFPVTECHARYQTAARYDDALSIDVWIGELARVRISFAYRIANQTGREIMTAETRHVCTALDEKIKRVPEELAARLHPYLFVPETLPQSG